MASRKPDWYEDKNAVTYVDVPEEHAGAIEIAWRRTRSLVPEVPLWMLEILKPRIVGIYMQGLMDGYEVRIREEAKTNG